MKENPLLKPFGLYVVMTGPVAGYEVCARAAVNSGVRCLQLRMKNEPREKTADVAWTVREITRGSGTLFIINDDVEIAKEVDADGVHLGQSDLPLDEARRVWDAPGKIFGLSTHSEAQAKDASALRPDYIGVGPVFPTPTKAVPDPDLGVERAGSIIRSAPLPCVAIGGINENNLATVLRAGAVNYCAVRAVMEDPTPGRTMERLQAVWKKQGLCQPLDR